MRDTFKKNADENKKVLYESLGEFVEGTWALGRKSKEIIDSYQAQITENGKELTALRMLQNTVLDLCCALDSLERGHSRTLANNLMMIFENYCVVLQLQSDSRAYSIFLKGDFESSKAVTLAKKQNREQKDFRLLLDLLDMQPDQLAALSFIAALLVEIGHLAEKIGTKSEQGYQKRVAPDEALFVLKLAEKAGCIMSLA